MFTHCFVEHNPCQTQTFIWTIPIIGIIIILLIAEFCCCLSVLERFKGTINIFLTPSCLSLPLSADGVFFFHCF